jgi:ABC-type Fe3+-siderophore transport system permease subunit
MIQDKGISTTTPNQFKSVISFKFCFSLITCVEIISIFCTYEFNIFTGLSIKAEKNDKDYNKAKDIILSGLIIYSVFKVLDIFLQISGLIYNYLKINCISMMLHLLEMVLLGYFYMDSWHYLIIWYIFIVTELICFCMEVCSLLHSVMFQFNKYNKIRANDVKYIRYEKDENEKLKKD